MTLRLISPNNRIKAIQSSRMKLSAKDQGQCNYVAGTNGKQTLSRKDLCVRTGSMFISQSQPQKKVT